MTDMTYDQEADAIYISLGQGPVDRTEEIGPFIYDVDSEGRIIGIEILSASHVLAPGDWKKPACPASGSPLPNRATSHLLRKMQRLMRDPAYIAEIRKEAALIAQHPQNAEIDDWIAQMYDWSEIVYDGDFNLPDAP